MSARQQEVAAGYKAVEYIETAQYDDVRDQTPEKHEHVEPTAGKNHHRHNKIDEKQIVSQRSELHRHAFLTECRNEHKRRSVADGQHERFLHQGVLPHDHEAYDRHDKGYVPRLHGHSSLAYQSETAEEKREHDQEVIAVAAESRYQYYRHEQIAQGKAQSHHRHRQQEEQRPKIFMPCKTKGPTLFGRIRTVM